MGQEDGGTVTASSSGSRAALELRSSGAAAFSEDVFEWEDGGPVLVPSSESRAAPGILPDDDGDGGNCAVALKLRSSGRLQLWKTI